MIREAAVLAVFAYGTLKTGHCRHRFWPFAPERTEKAWTLGELYDLGDYPALLSGIDMIAGELRWFSEPQLDQVLKILDEVEEYRLGHEATNLYNRVVLPCLDIYGKEYQAYAYRFAQPMHTRSHKRIEANYCWGERRLAVWPEGADW